MSILLLSFLTLVGQDVSASSGSSTPPWYLYDVETPLQRELLGLRGTVPAVLVLVEGDQVVRGSSLDARALGFDKLGAALRARGDHKTATAVFQVRFAQVRPGDNVDMLLWDALTGLARRAGFPTARPSTQFRNDGVGWAASVQRVREDLAGTGSPPEQSAIYLRFGRLYPVSSELARVLSGNARVFLDLDTPFTVEAVDAEIDEVQDEILDALERGAVEPGGTLALHLRVAADGYDRSHSSLFDAWNARAPELGFDAVNVTGLDYTGTVQAFQPRPAPDFTLPLLGREDPRTFRELAEDKVVLLSFWGVACGPCRTEAPYLTRLHRELADRGLLVLAVNSYDEEARTVQRYVDAHGLEHPILLQGSGVARDLYEVTAHPTTFLVDREGTLVERWVGFDPAEFEALRSRAQELVEE